MFGIDDEDIVPEEINPDLRKVNELIKSLRKENTAKHFEIQDLKKELLKYKAKELQEKLYEKK